MSPEPEPKTFNVYGLYRGLRPEPVNALDEADARATYHRAYPGMEGVIFKVEVVEVEDDDG